jgi:hypothetical protein
VERRKTSNDQQRSKNYYRKVELKAFWHCQTLQREPESSVKMAEQQQGSDPGTDKAHWKLSQQFRCGDEAKRRGWQLSTYIVSALAPKRLPALTNEPE